MKAVRGALIDINEIGSIDPMGCGIPTKPDDIRIRADDETGEQVRVFLSSGHALPFPSGHVIAKPERASKPRRTQDGVVDDNIDRSKVYKLGHEARRRARGDVRSIREASSRFALRQLEIHQKEPGEEENKAEWKAKLADNRRRKVQREENRRQRKAGGDSQIKKYIRRVAKKEAREPKVRRNKFSYFTPTALFKNKYMFYYYIPHFPRFFLPCLTGTN